MDFLQPTSWAEALEMKAADPEAIPIAGGTDVMVEINFDHRRPRSLMDLTRIEEVRGWEREGSRIVIGSGLTYRRVIDEIAGTLPALVMASRTVGSPQIRNRGTIGGNLGAASPAGDTHPALLAGDAVVEIESVRGLRQVGIDDFYLGVKRNCLAPDELIRSIVLDSDAGPAYFAKVGTRNAMVIAVCSFSLGLHPRTGRVRTGIGSAAPTPRRAHAAEEFLFEELTDLWHSRADLDRSLVQEFGRLAAAGASPIDDVRGTAGYRTHSLAVLARRTLGWAWADYQRGANSDRAEDVN
ncbi:xanthine dehydrogenase family protein subunit M [Nakamurella silvestris]|nr:xanthine dehydrogenase family protein subunit M [Nakamurella silvestris]